MALVMTPTGFFFNVSVQIYEWHYEQLFDMLKIVQIKLKRTYYRKYVIVDEIQHPANGPDGTTR